MPEGTEGTTEINRRTALKIIAGGVAAVSLVACGYYEKQSTKVEINDADYYLLREKAYTKSPRDYNSKYYDIPRNQYISDPLQGILLPQQDFFPNERSLFNWRDTRATPEMFEQNPVFKTIIQRTEKLISGASKSLGGMYQDYVLPQAVAIAVKRTLTYDSTKAKWGALFPFNSRVNSGYTDCQEFTGVVATALAKFGKVSDVAMHTYLDPNGTGRRLDHLYGAVDINNRCWIIDATQSEKIYPFWDYLRYQEKIKNIPEGGVIKYDSVFPNYELPWKNPQWTSIQSEQDKMAVNAVAFAMEKVEI